MSLISRGSEWNRWDLHVHTASSYDYKYKANDADKLLCQTLRDNNIKAVAITDHFLIDKNRIESLRSEAPEIVFFPGVELRCDKGADNLHLILIFSNESNLETLSSDFEAIMKRQYAYSKESDETIHWEFGRIVEFAQNHDALISIHAGRKTAGIDREISNALPVKQAIKENIADAVHFFELGQKRDIKDYEDHVFTDIDRKPLIICSDSHSPFEFKPNEKLWIKADITFEGLKQCLYQPQERVFIGDIPPLLDRVQKNKQSVISSLSCERLPNATNTDKWFDFSIPLNPSMVAVIGNKGSGKSAFSDILGHLCHSNTMEHASFLNQNRFRRKPKVFAKDYSATLTWQDKETRTESLDLLHENSTIEDAQYLPQKYIEDVCNAFEDSFQQEINRVIFSYVEKSEVSDVNNLEELVQLIFKPIDIIYQNDYTRLRDINREIIALEEKQTHRYQTSIVASLEKAKETLRRHEKSKPEKIQKPNPKDNDTSYQTQLNQLNQNIQEIKEEIQKVYDSTLSIKTFINDTQTIVAKMNALKNQFDNVQNEFELLVKKYNLNRETLPLELKLPVELLSNMINLAEEKKKKLKESVLAPDKGLDAQLKKIENEKKQLISSANEKEKQYQKYLVDLASWSEQKDQIIGNQDISGSIKFLENELDYIDNQLPIDYQKAVGARDEIARRLYQRVSCLSEVYRSIYAPVQEEIAQLLSGLENGIEFKADVLLNATRFAKDFLNYINQKYNGKFGRSRNSTQEVENCIRATDFGNEDSVINFLHSLAEVITDDLDLASNRVTKRQDFYDFLFGLKYLDVNFQLKLNGQSLEELSPGERGIVLLIFYLALSKESKPIIIDQPEDNLDNQSVFSKLVPCIIKAKQKRQVIIVTHNPNIAVACDAEQIIFCKKTNDGNKIHYESASIENPEMRKHVVDVLEGTKPAFNLRSRKYG